MCHNVEIIASSAVKAIAADNKSSIPASFDDYLAINVLDRKLGTRRWMKTICPVTFQAIYSNRRKRK